jgi:arylsulfatase
MGSTYTSLPYHGVFSTKIRTPFIDRVICERPRAHSSGTTCCLFRPRGAFLAALLVCVSFTVSAAPNFLAILVDDMGYSDIGCYGGEIKTPRLDDLAANGLRYTQFYNTARCWPTRAALMSGYYPQQINRDKVGNIPGGGRGVRPAWAPLFVQDLKRAGYRSYHSGKWHIDGMPIATGFDRSYYLNDQHRFYNPTLHHEDDKKLPPVKRESGYYGTTAVSDKAVEYLKQHQAEHNSKPFFAYVAFAAPHFPLHAPAGDVAKVGDRYKVGWEVIRQQRWARIQKLGIATGTLSKVEPDVGPPYHFADAYKILGDGEVNKPLPWAELTAKQKAFQADKMAVHAAMIERMDAEIGRILDQIKAMNAYDDTLILFFSDNGASAEIMVRGDGHKQGAPAGSADSHLCLGPGWSSASNTPFRMHKTWVHEGGSCTPLIAHWPKGITAKGELRRSTGHVIDIAPTLLELAGVKRQPTGGAPAFPGRSLAPTFKHDANWSRTLWWAHDGHHAIRVGDMKAVKTKQGDWELFDLANDRAETSNLAKANPEKLAELTKQWQATVDGFAKLDRGPKPGQGRGGKKGKKK